MGRRNREKVKEMIREDRLDMAISEKEESEMTPEFLMGRLGRKCLFPKSGNTQVYREGQTYGKQSFHICLIEHQMEVSNFQSLGWQVKGKSWCLSLLVFKF